MAKQKNFDKPRFLIGFDPSSNGFGYFVLDCQYKKPRLAEYGTVEGRVKLDSEPHSVRLALIKAKVIELKAKYQPLYRKVFIEDGFAQFKKETQALFRVRGVVESELVEYELVAYKPNTIKKETTGYGHAAKGHVGQEIQRMLDIEDEEMSDDETDAGGVAVLGYNKEFTKDFPNKEVLE